MRNMISTLRKSLQIRGKLFHSSRVSYGARPALPPLTKVQELEIVKVVNKSSVEEFEKYQINLSQVKKILAYREKNGEFETFDDILMTQDIPLMMKLCKSILSGGKQPRKNKSPRERKPVITPAIDPLEKGNIKKTLGLCVEGNQLCWAMIDENKRLCDWNYGTFVSPSKITLIDSINMIMRIISGLPNADAYVMESDPYVSLSRLTTVAFAFHLQRQQIIAIIISVLKMRHQSNEHESDRVNNFYMLQARAAAKKYNLILGSEVISAESLINNILAGTPNSNNELSNPVDPGIILQYESAEKKIREQLSSALLVAMTFVDFINHSKST